MNGACPSTLIVDGGYASWRSQALRALAARWPPEAVTWVERGSVTSATTAQMPLDYPTTAPVVCDEQTRESGADSGSTGLRVSVSSALASLLQDAALYRSPQRWALLYRVVWRWWHGDRAVASAADEDGARLHAMARSVRRAKHDMIAYVRFHRRGGAAMPEYLAWYEPEHDVLAYAAEHFARRMGTSSWWIGTPQGTALWDGATLQFSAVSGDAVAIRADAAVDEVESLWLAYYKSTFNPARLNETALHQHMPVRFWKSLPEGPLIPAMIADARSGTRRMAQASTVRAMTGKPVIVDAQRARPSRPVPSSLDECRRCELWRNATQAVPGHGPETARMMLIGEQPGDYEDLAGRAFVGPAGQVLDEALRRAGVPRDTVFLTNAVKHFKWLAHGKRRLHKTPAQREIDACAHWLEHELARVRPAVIVTLGATALRAVLRRNVNMQDYLHAPVRLGDTWLVATWHPSYALRVDDAAAREKIVAAMGKAVACGQQLATAAVDAGCARGMQDASLARLTCRIFYYRVG